MNKKLVFFILSVLITPIVKTEAQNNPPKQLAMLAAQRFSQQETTIKRNDMVHIPGGTFMMGADNSLAQKDEKPKHPVSITAFWLDATPVTNKAFQDFVNATHYQSSAEKKPDWVTVKKQLPPGTPKPDETKLIPASLVFVPLDHPVPLDDASQWWTWKPGANWQHPHGQRSSIADKAEHPVVHISWEDANAYCHWRGKRLPTEAEWEWAVRGGLENKLYPWGNEPLNKGTPKANTWQGEFPYNNTLQDKFFYTSPVRTFPSNGYGLYDMVGNVWEWTQDWYSADYYASFRNVRVIDPQGPSKSFDPAEPKIAKKVLRGASFLCSEAYCHGIRVSARMRATPDTTTEDIGFRCASS